MLSKKKKKRVPPSSFLYTLPDACDACWREKKEVTNDGRGSPFFSGVGGVSPSSAFGGWEVV